MLSSRKLWWKPLSVCLATLVLAVPARAADPDPLTPGDADVVVSVNLKQILDSALVKKYALAAMQLALQSPDAQKILTATGLDPLKDLDSVTFVNAGTTSPKWLVVVRGKFDGEKIAAAAEAEAKKDPKLKVSKEGGLTIFEMSNNAQTAFATVANRGSIVVSNEKDHLVKSAKNVGPAMPNAELKTALGKVGGKESLWLAALVTEERKKAMQNNPQTAQFASKLQSVTGSLNLTDAATLAIQVHTADAKAAGELKKVVEQLKPFLQLFAAGDEQAGPIVKEIVEAIKVETQQNAVTIDLKVSEELLKKLKKD